MIEVDEFLKAFKPNRGAYVQKDAANNLQTVAHFLSDALIERHMKGLGGHTLSFFAPKERRDYLGVDIDDHVDGGWDRGKPTMRLENKYRAVVTEIGKEPSVAFASTRGIHAFWFLDRKVPNEIILAALEERLEENLKAEILPRPAKSLGIPRPEEYINCYLQRERFPGYESIQRYSAIEILGDAAKPENIRAKLKKKSFGGTPKWGKDPIKNIEEAEAMVLPLKNGETNEVYCTMVGIYKANGLSVTQAYERFQSLCARSSGYSGALLSGLQARIDASYRNLKGSTAISMDSFALLRKEPAIAMAIEFVTEAAGVTKNTRSRMALEGFLLNLVAWIRSIDRVFANRERAAYWDYIYNGSRRFHQEGYYSLTFKLMKKWNSHYDRWLGELISLGILVESPYGYSSTGHRSKYYAFQLFSCRIAHRPINEADRVHEKASA